MTLTYKLAALLRELERAFPPPKGRHHTLFRDGEGDLILQLDWEGAWHSFTLGKDDLDLSIGALLRDIDGLMEPFKPKQPPAGREPSRAEVALELFGSWLDVNLQHIGGRGMGAILLGAWDDARDNKAGGHFSEAFVAEAKRRVAARRQREEEGIQEAGT